MPELRVVAIGAEGPEDVAVDAEGRILAGLADGTILRVSLSEAGQLDRSEVIAHTGGRPLGLETTADGGLLVCDAWRGLLQVDPGDGAVRVLAHEVEGAPLRFCSNVAAAADGTIYFSVSSHRYGLEDWLGDILEQSGAGQLLRLRPGGDPEVLLSGLQFANGVALAADESFVTVAESGAYRLSRFWLAGPQAGRHDTLIRDLPGFPDNISRSPGGLFWVALAGPREASVDWLHRASPVFRWAAWTVVRKFRPRPRSTVRVLSVSPDGRLLRDLLCSKSPYRMVTSVREHNQRLIMGSLVERGVAVCDLFPSAPAF
ncbi:SMP-30/gluconolactonase/LRE family protein [Streptomyces sp. NPDC004647]|uniref:SMP-30/gluconolactonase/LRE family protein n=1 Tax=Streptomyces sp. NPDC004647 TaxID=3154671 RepID=UPI0033A904F7